MNAGKRMSRGPDQLRSTRERAREQVRAEERTDLVARITLLRDEIYDLAFRSARAVTPRRPSIEVLASSAKLLEEIREHLVGR